ncbi:hypothetical protein HU200_042888 [Digitaria exilis]|uniref:Uncharacterized protein n=1 Tax=Digitaria exilis TaxID=1010633 RepID=A0A835BBU6_9POAL|nr:hypothetical protein HU200_042888 [Digitaria exilis]
MNRSNSNKRQTKSSNRATGEPAAVVPDGASSPCVVNMGRAHSSAAGGARSSAAGGAPRASGLPTPCAPGASGLPSPRAPPTSGFLAVGGHAAGQWCPSPSSSEWIYPQGGFTNILQSPRVPFVNYPNGSQMQENFHFVGGPMNYSSTPSPNGSPDAGVAQVTEAVDVKDDDTIQPANSNARSNASATSIDPTDARSDRRLNWSNEEDIRLAKEERNGKRKGPEAIVAIGEKLDKFMEATTKAGKIAEVQQNLADKNLEVAKEQTKSKMLDLYRELLCART